MEELELVKKMIKILEGLKNCYCWCDVGIGNPMMKGRHSDSCKETKEFYDSLINR